MDVLHFDAQISGHLTYAAHSVRTSGLFPCIRYTNEMNYISRNSNLFVLYLNQVHKFQNVDLIFNTNQTLNFAGENNQNTS